VVVVLACGVVVHVNELFCVLALLESCCEIRIAFGAYAVVDEFSAEQLDNIAKKLVPSLYAIVLLVVYSLHKEDGYSGTTTPMYEGLASGEGAYMELRPSMGLGVAVALTFLAIWSLKKAANSTFGARTRARLAAGTQRVDAALGTSLARSSPPAAAETPQAPARRRSTLAARRRESAQCAERTVELLEARIRHLESLQPKAPGDDGTKASLAV